MVDAKLFMTCAAAFLAVTFYLGYLGYRQTRNADDFMVTGKRVSPVVLALSYGAALISTSAIVGFGGISAVYGAGLMWLTVLCIIVGVIIAFVFFGKRIRRLGRQLGAVTLPDLLGKRFKSPFMQYASAAMILAAMPLYCAAIMIGGQTSSTSPSASTGTLPSWASRPSRCPMSYSAASSWLCTLMPCKASSCSSG